MLGWVGLGFGMITANGTDRSSKTEVSLDRNKLET